MGEGDKKNVNKTDESQGQGREDADHVEEDDLIGLGQQNGEYTYACKHRKGQIDSKTEEDSFQEVASSPRDRRTCAIKRAK